MLSIIWDRFNIFIKKLACIVVNKAHLIWVWKTFRKKYAKLKMLRHFFPKVSIMAVSIILTLNILGYIEEFLHLHFSTCLYRQPLDHPNTTLIVNNITKLGFTDLNILISKARLIPKIIVFIDKIDSRIALAACF